MGKIIYKELSFFIVGLLFEAYNELGPGYKEVYYERIFEKLLQREGACYKRQFGYSVFSRKRVVARVYLDFLIDNKVVVELKKGDYYSRKNIEQVYNYLKATNLKLGIIANFTSRGVKYKRIINL